MQLEIIKENGFPVLSWGAIFNLKENSLKAYVGRHIETFENGLIEGCHTGEHILDDIDYKILVQSYNHHHHG